MSSISTAGVLVIGDEILSGRTKDRNSGYIADRLTEVGIDLKEIRVVSDNRDAIVDALHALRTRYTYVFTTGGIGPTHDDITADCVAAAFNVPIDVDQRAVDAMLERYEQSDLTPARLRMARIPQGAELIPNPVSKAPGFHLENVFVMAGVPDIMHAMMDDVIPRLSGGKAIFSRTIEAGRGEGAIAEPLAQLQSKYPDVSMGSYPYVRDGSYQTSLVLKSRDEALLDQAAEELRLIIDEIHSNS